MNHNTFQNPVDNDELIDFISEYESDKASLTAATWRIFIVDDDIEVHQATEFSLSGLEIMGRPLELLHAYSAAEAKEKIDVYKDIAVILLDVVMETDDAGLKFVTYIREEKKLPLPRIVLRTGQPGYAPELEVLSRYDINDYRTKSELSHNRVIGILTSAIRSYEQLRSIKLGYDGLQTILKSSSDLILRADFADFLDGLGKYIDNLRDDLSAWVITLIVSEEKNAIPKYKVVSASCKYASYVGLTIDMIQDEAFVKALQRLKETNTNVITESSALLYCNSNTYPMLIYLEGHGKESFLYRDLAQLFANNVGLCIDIVALIGRLHDLAYRDPMTGLANRNQFLQTVETLINTQFSDSCIALMDIDDFNTISSTIGPHTGDQLLRAIAERLKCVFNDDPVIIARIAGDAFGLQGPASCLSAERLQSIFLHPITVNEESYPISVTTGMAAVKGHWVNGISLLTAAYTALKKAKQKQRGGVGYYSAEMSRQVQERVQMTLELKHAISNNEFYLVYQPQISIHDGRLIGVEALIRWCKPDGSLVSPEIFIPIAETCGLINAIGRWVFEQANTTLNQLMQNGWHDLVMGINVSVEQLRQPDFFIFVRDVLTKHNVKPANVEIEITESTLMQEIEMAWRSIEDCKKLGLRISLDDFGTGFSSLAYLRRLKIDRLKIDRSFINELVESHHDRDIAGAIAQLGQQLKMEVLAEGVETQQQQIILKDLGYDSIQGYLHARPMAIDELQSWMYSRSNHG